MATIKAPFNFVPLSDKVFFPNWADQISQDIPFSDGISGTIDLKITAESLIFVRNGHTREDAEAKNGIYKSFSKAPDGRYFIPATSIKGCIRNVLEIMSFGKMSQIANTRYSIRDLQLKKYLDFFQNTDIHCGWLTINGETASITDNGIPRRISHKLIDEKFKTDFCELFANKAYLKIDKNRSPLIKYAKVGGKSLDGCFKDLPLDSNNIVDKRIKVKFDEKGQRGRIVFTGQPSYRKPAEKNIDGTIRCKASGKFYEFVFYSKTYNTFHLNTEEDNGLYKDFCFVYKDSEEWKYWKQKMKSGEAVPVFFSLKDGHLLHFGLSYLYKLPYIQRMKNYLSEDHKKSDFDLCECIFGAIDNKKSLKGRVQFSNAFCEKPITFKTELNPYMGSPKPTYYPIYLKQKGSDGYMSDMKGKGIPFSTMLDKDAILKGWKRYPIKDKCQTEFNIPDNQEDNTNPFIPLDKDSAFICKLRFHNLRKEELGALLYAIELRQTYNHSIGFAKAFGYGRIKIEIQSNTMEFSKNDVDELKQCFINMMSKNIDNYSKTPQIKELWAMLHVQNLKEPLEYMELKDFVNCKKQHFKEDRNQTFGEYLPWYTELIKKEVQHDMQRETLTAIATVSLWKPLKQAHLVDGKDTSKKELIVNDSKAKLKIGDKIEVDKIMKGGNVQKLKFRKKL